MGQPFDAYHKWLGIPKEDQPPNHYRLLGIQQFESDPDVIESAADQRMTHIRGYQSGRHAELSQQILNEVAAARLCLLSPAKRAAYDEELKLAMPEESPSPGPTASPLSAMPSDLFPTADEVLSPRKARQQAAIRSARRKQQIPVGPIVGIVAAVGFMFVLIIVLHTTTKESPPPASSPTEQPAPPLEKKKTPLPSPPKPRQIPKKADSPKPTAQPQPKPKAVEPEAEQELVLDEVPPKEKNKAVLKVDSQLADSPRDAVEAAGDLLASRSAPLGAEKPSPVAAPSAEEQAVAIQRARDVFKDELARAKTPESRQTLANTLLEQAERTASSDPAAAFALLRLSRDLASQAADGIGAFRAIDVLAERFDVDPATMKAEVLGELATKARTSIQHASIAEQAADQMDEAMTARNFALADQFAKLAVSESSKGHDKMLATRVRESVQEIRVAQKLTADFEAARAKLAEDPENSDANSVAALYHCFLMGDWENGLPFLSKGNDAAMKALAQREIGQAPRDPEGRVNLADAWWDLAQKVSGKRKEKMLLHAREWYLKAQPALTDSLIQAKVEKRLDEIERIDRKLHVGASPELY